jgi:cell division protein YceG involved in septum cleavage
MNEPDEPMPGPAQDTGIPPVGEPESLPTGPKAGVPAARILSLGLVLLLLAVLAVLWLLFAPAGRRDARGDLAIQPGMGLASIARDLDSLGISTHPRAFLLLARLMGVDREIKPGVFPLDGRMSRRAILLMLRNDAVPGATVRIPEGLRLQETAGLVQQQCHLDSLRSWPSAVIRYSSPGWACPAAPVTWRGGCSRTPTC